MGSESVFSSQSSIRDMLDFQFQISWQVLEMHLKEVGEEEYLWRPASKGLHISNESGGWKADWPESEEYNIGPPSMAWLVWHIIFWWSMVLDHCFGDGLLTREQVICPGSIEEARERIYRLRDEWQEALAKLSDEELLSSVRTKWPFSERPFCELAAWLNLELMKNASEIGYFRFLYGSKSQ